jgi:hypothetical protein
MTSLEIFGLLSIAAMIPAIGVLVIGAIVYWIV